MSRDALIEKMNRILESEGYKEKSSSLSDVRNFLGRKEHFKGKVYDDIQELYEQLIYGAGMW